MKIAIIGANGFIGNRLVETLHLDPASPHTPVPVVRQPASLALPARFGLDCRVASALDAGALAEALGGCDAVVHAALGDSAQIEKMPAVLCAAAARAGAGRVVYISSASVHGQNIPPGTTEQSRLRTRHALDYSNAKVRAERAFFRHARRRGLHATALRPGIVYGPRSRWIADTAGDLRAGVAWLHDEGRAVCNTLYVDNLIHAIRLALERETAPRGGAYFVCDAETLTWANFFSPIARALGIEPGDIPRVDKLPAFPRTFAKRLGGVIASPAAQRLMPLFPHRIKQTFKKTLAALDAPPRPEAWTLPARPSPRVTQELAELQRNRTKLSHDKAARLLGYEPVVTFAEGMRRSLDWLRFARPDLFGG